MYIFVYIVVFGTIMNPFQRNNNLPLSSMPRHD